MSVEARKPWKVFAGVLQWVGTIIVIASVANLIVHFGLPKWAFYIGASLFFIGMLGGMKVTWFRKYR